MPKRCAALGVEAEALVQPANAPTGPMAAFCPHPPSVAVPGQTFEVRVNYTPRLSSEARFETLRSTPRGWKVDALGERKFRVTVPASAASNAAFWSRDSVRQTLYRYASDALFGQPIPEAPLHARVSYEYRGAVATVRTPALVSYMDERGLQHRRAIATGPALSLETETDAGIFPIGKAAYNLDVQLRHIGSEPMSGTVRLKLPAGWRSEPGSAPFQFGKEGEAVSAAFRVIPPDGLKAGRITVLAIAQADGREYRSSFRAVTQPGFEVIYEERPATHEIALVDAKIAPDQRIGYVMGAGDSVPAGLEQLGASVELLDASALAAGDLSRYDSIWLGIRAYAVRPDLLVYNARLLDYTKNGGVLVVQYNTPEFDHNYGPYSYQMTRRPEEVSEEDSPVTILAPEAPVFRWPNRITTDDFTGWVEQRGSKHLVSWASEYQPLVEMHDRGQAPQRASGCRRNTARGCTSIVHLPVPPIALCRAGAAASLPISLRWGRRMRPGDESRGAPPELSCSAAGCASAELNGVDVRCFVFHEIRAVLFLAAKPRSSSRLMRRRAWSPSRMNSPAKHVGHRVRFPQPKVPRLLQQPVHLRKLRQ